MVKFVHVLRSVGNLDAVPAVFQACETFCPLSIREAGYSYCKGLYFWYVYEVREALVHLNKVRGDREWGERAVELMVQICLNPDKDVFGGEVLDKRQTDVSESENPTGIVTAQDLLKEFHARSKSEEQKVRVLQNLCLIYGEEAKETERAVLDLTEMLSNNVMLEACLLAVAQGFLQLKQIPRARNSLKRLTRMEWRDSNADLLEKASLLMADMYIKMGKSSHVNKLLDDCIRHNKSCSKAYEYRGFVMENEQRYSDASLQYELAWKYTCWKDPGIGFRLAFNCLKCKNYTRAVDVCHQVLKRYPDYPQIQDQILTRAQTSLRP